MGADPNVGSFIKLSEQVHEAGLMGHHHGFYWHQIIFWPLSGITVLVAVILLGDARYQLIFAGFLGAAMSQVGFISH